jgi:RNA recognition motif-containing protein
MIRNIPCKYTQARFMAEVMEFNSNFDFLYLPPARTAKQDKNLGYAFINFRTEEDCRDFIEAFQGYRFKFFPNSVKRASVSPAELQGKDANMDYYLSSKVAKTRFTPYCVYY